MKKIQKRDFPSAMKYRIIKYVLPLVLIAHCAVLLMTSCKTKQTVEIYCQSGVAAAINTALKDLVGEALVEPIA
jgi:hypothetical protein